MVMYCDKCGKPVEYSNDASRLDALVTGCPEIVLFASARHLLPAGDCEGSPSRAQYIEGQPRDTRGYEYDPELELKIREAYAAMQEGN